MLRTTLVVALWTAAGCGSGSGMPPVDPAPVPDRGEETAGAESDGSEVASASEEGAETPADVQASRVRERFRAYKEALQQRDGTAAVPLVSGASIGFYARCRDLALTASEEEVRELGFSERFTVLSFRHRSDAEELRAMSPTEVFAYVIDHGWTADIEDVRIAEVDVNGERAVAQLADAWNDEPGLPYVREDGEWRLDLVRLIELTDDQMDALAESSGTDQDDQILSTLELLTGTAPTADIWEPLEDGG